MNPDDLSGETFEAESRRLGDLFANLTMALATTADAHEQGAIALVVVRAQAGEIRGRVLS